MLCQTGALYGSPSIYFVQFKLVSISKNNQKNINWRAECQEYYSFPMLPLPFAASSTSLILTFQYHSTGFSYVKKVDLGTFLSFLVLGAMGLQIYPSQTRIKIFFMVLVTSLNWSEDRMLTDIFVNTNLNGY